MLIIGSRAAHHQIPGFRSPKDWDIVAGAADCQRILDHLSPRLASVQPGSGGNKLKLRLSQGEAIEVEIAELIESAGLLLEMKHEGSMDFFGLSARVAAPDLLYLIKKSHIRRPIHWQKSIADLHALAPFAGQSDAQQLRFYDLRKAETHARVPGKEPSLDMRNSDFFRQKHIPVELPFPHDAYHWAVAYGDRPVFYDLKRDGSKAWCEQDLFEALPLEQRLNCVREETMVIALERYLIPGLVADQEGAYSKALERVCTTLTGGWFREFAIEHWPLLNTPDRDFLAAWEARKEWALSKAA